MKRLYVEFILVFGISFLPRNHTVVCLFPSRPSILNKKVLPQYFPLYLQKTMYHLTLVALLSVVAMATPTLACSTPLPTYKFRQLYCDADLVFRGFQVQASSSLATDLYGREVRRDQQQYMQFNGSRESLSWL